MSDLVLWSSATDLEAHRLGPVAALQVNGSARDLVRELTPDQLANVVVDPQTGLMVLVRTLIQRKENEVPTKAVSEFLQFSRIPGELSPSGHLILPVNPCREAKEGQVLDFGTRARSCSCLYLLAGVQYAWADSLQWFGGFDAIMEFVEAHNNLIVGGNWRWRTSGAGVRNNQPTTT